MFPLIVLILLNLAINAGLYGIFEKTGEKGWKALVPGWNYWIWNKLVQKPKYWAIIGCLPFIGLVVSLIWITETCKCFGRGEFKDHTLAQFLPFIYLPYLGFSNQKWLGPENPVMKMKNKGPREWSDALVYAFIAAYGIRAFTFELYQIPTQSMEKTLLVGDYLIVNKFSYGARIPRTPVAIPFVHHTIPFLNIQGYFGGIQLPFMQFPKLDTIERNDIVVFNYPAGDEHIVDFTPKGIEQYSRGNLQLAERLSSKEGRMQLGGQLVYYKERIQTAAQLQKIDPTIKWEDALAKADDYLQQIFVTINRPVDKRENYIKRCVGMPGDTLSISNGQLMIDGIPAFEAKNQQFQYQYKTSNTKGLKGIDEKYDLYLQDQNYTSGPRRIPLPEGQMTLTKWMKNELVENIGFDTIYQLIDYIPRPFFSFAPTHSNLSRAQTDNYPEIIIPKKGMTVELTTDNVLLYGRVIEIYEGHEIRKESDNVYIDGEAVTSYTFEMNHYFMMGDNRHHSLDSRAWGFVPEDHIVGRPSMVLASRNLAYGFFNFSKWRWDRLFMIVDEKE